MRDLEKLADEIASKIDRTVSDAERKIKKKWKGNWEARVHSAGSDFQSATDSFKRVPDRLSDLATDGSCAMRYLFAYGLIGMAALMGFCGLMLVLILIGRKSPLDQWHNPIHARKTQWWPLSNRFLAAYLVGRSPGQKIGRQKSTRQKSASHTPSRPGKRGQPHRDRSRYGHQDNG